MFKRFKTMVACGALVFGVSVPVAATEIAASAVGVPVDKLSEMFTWWNQAMKTPGGFTDEAFAKYFTADAPLLIDGVEVMRGPAGWAKRFQGIQQAVGAGGGAGAVEIVVPFRHSFQKDNRIYTYHVIRSRANGRVSCMLAAGHADIQGGLLSEVSLVRAEIDPAADADCWKK